MEKPLDEIKFLKTCSEAGKRIKELQNAVIVHHFDADGIPAGAIVFSAMFVNGIAPAMQCWKKTTEENLQKLSQTSYKQIIFCDLGAGYTSTLEKFLPNREIIILDHHEPEQKLEERAANITVVNPHDFGIDGAREACGGSVAYLCFREYKELSQLAMVSIVGDLQDRDSLTGVNKTILQDGVDAGAIQVKKDLKLFGKTSRSLISFLSYCTEPFLPELTGNDKNCAIFLHDNDIPYKVGEKYVSYYELSEDDKKKLTSAVITHCIEKGLSEGIVSKAIGDCYVFPNEDKLTPFYDCQEFATLVNACGRNGKGDIGVGACLKNLEDRQKALEILKQHRENLRRGITLGRNKVSDLGLFYLLDARRQISDSIIGTIAGAVLNSGELEQNKPIIGIANDEDDFEMVKISCRATNQLVEKGLDLNEMLRDACNGLGKSVGGGHKIAAGASVEKKHLSEFLKRCAAVLKGQLN